MSDFIEPLVIVAGAALTGVLLATVLHLAECFVLAVKAKRRADLIRRLI